MRLTRISFKLISDFFKRLSALVGMFVFSFLFGIQLMASPASLTYQGRILKSDGTPLEYSNVSFVFQITDPTGQCVIYQEQIIGINMTNSAGVFDVPIGKGAVQYPLGGSTNILDVFNNSNSFTCGGCSLVNGSYTCVNGTSTYAGADGDTRRLRVSFYDGSAWRTITPDNIVRSVPFAGYALSAQKLGTNVASDFLLKTGLPTCGAGTFLSYDGAALTCVPIAGASGGTVTNVTAANSYLTVTNNTSAPVLTLNVGTVANTVAAGNDPRLSDPRTPSGAAGGVLNGSYPNPGLVDNAVTNTKINDGAVSTSKLFAIPGISRLVATDSTTGTTLAPLSCASGQLLTWGVNGWQCSNQNSIAVGSASTATTATSAANFTGSLVGDVTGTQGATSVDKIKGVPLDFSVAPTNGQVLKFNGTNWVPSTASSYSGVLPIVNGGTNSSAALNNNRIMVSSGNAIVEASALTNGQLFIGSTGAAPVAASLTAGSGITISPAAGSITIGTTGLQASSLADGKIWVGQTGTPTAVTPSGDATMTNAGVFKVTGIQGISVSATSPSIAGQVLRYDGTSVYTPAFLGLADIKSGITPFVGAFTNAGCIASQSLYWQSSTDTFECQSVAIGDSQITYASKTANTFLAAPSGTAGAPTFRGIASADLPTTGVNGAYVNSGNSFGAAATLGTNDANTFGIKTNNATRMTIDTSGNVGIGTTNPQHKLTIAAGDVALDNNYSIRFQNSAGNGSSIFKMSAADNFQIFNYNGSIQYGANSASGDHRFQTGAGEVERMRITTSGDVGIGTTTPAAKLDIVGTIRVGDDGVACSAATIGAVRTNSTTSLLESCDGTSWLSLNSDSAVPPSSVILMNSCPAGWADNGTTPTGSGGAASCGGVACHLCQSPNSYQALPANSIVLMESCPTKWTSLGALVGSGASVAFANISFTSCQSPAQASALPQNSRIVMDTCPGRWNDLGQTPTGGGASALCPSGQCHICQVPGVTMGRSLLGDSGGSTLTGGNVVLRGGAGGSTSGNGGAVLISGGTPVDGIGGSILITASNGVTSTATTRDGGTVTLGSGNGVSNGKGGDLTLYSGAGNGTGTNGNILLNSSGVGNVGIGTTTPSQKLSVAGTIESTAGGIKFPDGTTQTTAATSAASIKGWVNFQGESCTGGAGSDCTIRASYNVSSVTRNGTGIYTITWSNAFADSNYVVTGSCQRTDVAASIMFQLGRGQTTYPLTTTTAVVGCGNYDGNGVDGGTVTLQAVGN